MFQDEQVIWQFGFTKVSLIEQDSRILLSEFTADENGCAEPQTVRLPKHKATLDHTIDLLKTIRNELTTMNVQPSRPEEAVQFTCEVHPDFATCKLIEKREGEKTKSINIAPSEIPGLIRQLQFWVDSQADVQALVDDEN